MGRRSSPPRGHRSRSRPPVIGVDVGGVLVDRASEGSDTSFFGDRPLETPAVPGALEAIPELTAHFGASVHIVSKAGPKIAGLTVEWLAHHALLDNVGGLSRDRIHFVRKRADKADVCRRLGVTHFVDDRLDVLAHLTTVDHRFLFVGGLGCHTHPTEVPTDVVVVATWPELLDRLRPTTQTGDPARC